MAAGIDDGGTGGTCKADEGIERAHADLARATWIAEAREGLAFEAEHLAKQGPLLARYRTVQTRS